jgi:hypothetical protein
MDCSINGNVIPDISIYSVEPAHPIFLVTADNNIAEE